MTDRWWQNNPRRDERLHNSAPEEAFLFHVRPDANAESIANTGPAYVAYFLADEFRGAERDDDGVVRHLASLIGRVHEIAQEDAERISLGARLDMPEPHNDEMTQENAEREPGQMARFAPAMLVVGAPAWERDNTDPDFVRDAMQAITSAGAAYLNASQWSAPHFAARLRELRNDRSDIRHAESSDDGIFPMLFPEEPAQQLWDDPLDVARRFSDVNTDDPLAPYRHPANPLSGDALRGLLRGVQYDARDE